MLNPFCCLFFFLIIEGQMIALGFTAVMNQEKYDSVHVSGINESYMSVSWMLCFFLIKKEQ